MSNNIRSFKGKYPTDKRRDTTSLDYPVHICFPFYIALVLSLIMWEYYIGKMKPREAFERLNEWWKGDVEGATLKQLNRGYWGKTSGLVKGGMITGNQRAGIMSFKA